MYKISILLSGTAALLSACSNSQSGSSPSNTTTALNESSPANAVADASPSNAANAQSEASDVTTYHCTDRRVFTAEFDIDADTVTLRSNGTSPARLKGKPAASGMWYEGEGHVLRGKGSQADITTPDGKTSSCTG